VTLQGELTVQDGPSSPSPTPTPTGRRRIVAVALAAVVAVLAIVAVVSMNSGSDSEPAATPASLAPSQAVSHSYSAGVPSCCYPPPTTVPDAATPTP
jgi:hypothetical protein